jgi:hypothetical protein
MSPDGRKIIILCHPKTNVDPTNASLYFSNNYGFTFIEKTYPGTRTLIFDGKTVLVDDNFCIAMENYGYAKISTDDCNTWSDIPSDSFSGGLTGSEHWRGLGTSNNNNIILLGFSDLNVIDPHIWKITNKMYTNTNSIQKIPVVVANDNLPIWQPSEILVSDDGQRIVIANYAQKPVISWDGGITWKVLHWSNIITSISNNIMFGLVGNSDLSVIRACSFAGPIYTMFPEWDKESNIADMNVDTNSFGDEANWYKIINVNIGQNQNEILTGITYQTDSDTAYGLFSTICD